MSKVNTNVCIITGNLTRDAELKYTANQKPVLTFAVAVNRLGQDNAQATDYFNCVFWGKTGETLVADSYGGIELLGGGGYQQRPPQQPQQRRNDWNPMDVEPEPQRPQQYAQEPGNIPF